MPSYHAALEEGSRGSVIALFELLSKFHDGPRKDFGIHQGGVSTVRFDVWTAMASQQNKKFLWVAHAARALLRPWLRGTLPGNSQ